MKFCAGIATSLKLHGMILVYEFSTIDRVLLAGDQS